MIGRTVLNWKIIEEIGSGGMGVVYKARDLNLNRYIAIKQLYPFLVKDLKFQQRFKREAQIQVELDHPSIVKVITYYNDGDGYFILMDYIEGRTLAHHIDKNVILPDDMIYRLFFPILDGLEYAHKRNIIHCDIKPSNIIINKDGEAKITDFGIARILTESKGLTEELTRVFTIKYASPEQLDEESRIDHRSDIYSIGQTLYECACGVNLFKKDSHWRIMHKKISGEIPKPRKINPQINKGLEKVILKSMMKNPDKRYQNVGELVNDLGSVFKRQRSIPWKRTAAKRKTWPSWVKGVAITLTILVLMFVTGFIFLQTDWFTRRLERPSIQPENQLASILNEKKSRLSSELSSIESSYSNYESILDEKTLSLLEKAKDEFSDGSEALSKGNLEGARSTFDNTTAYLSQARDGLTIIVTTFEARADSVRNHFTRYRSGREVISLLQNDSPAQNRINRSKARADSFFTERNYPAGLQEYRDLEEFVRARTNEYRNRLANEARIREEIVRVEQLLGEIDTTRLDEDVYLTYDNANRLLSIASTELEERKYGDAERHARDARATLEAVQAATEISEQVAEEVIVRDAILNITIIPYGDVYIDSRLINRSVKELKRSIQPGIYTIRVENPEHGKRTKSVEVRGDEKMDIVFDLTK